MAPEKALKRTPARIRSPTATKDPSRNSPTFLPTWSEVRWGRREKRREVGLVIKGVLYERGNCAKPNVCFFFVLVWFCLCVRVYVFCVCLRCLYLVVHEVCLSSLISFI